ncbi:MAG: hypothetical protein FWD15_01425 [Alphaproteobacteria bacterium]|nr:hypothetical protein [Alphaproteobacteria bacterium]
MKKVSKKTQAQAYAKEQAQKKLEGQLVEKFREMLPFAERKGNITYVIINPNRLAYKYVIKEALGYYTKGESDKEKAAKDLVISSEMYNNMISTGAGNLIILSSSTISSMQIDALLIHNERSRAKKVLMTTSTEKWAVGNFRKAYEQLAVAEK